MSPSLEHVALAPGLSIPRIVTGLWQVADQERDGALDRAAAAAAMLEYAHEGFTAFDMADHYGSAELIAGEAMRGSPGSLQVFTKWCPTPGPMDAATVRRGVQERLQRLGVERIDLLQFHWWTFEHPAWLDALGELDRLREEGIIAHLGVTNFDTDHLHVALQEGIPIVSNQVCVSPLDRRALADMSELCLAGNVKLLAYGTLAGGFVAERWLDAPEPDDVNDWSKMKYGRFIAAAGGWPAFQSALTALAAVAARHDAAIAGVATRWLLAQPAVAAAIIGARLTERQHRAGNAAVFELALTDDDLTELDDAFTTLTPIPGDCGDEYRRPPFLTASGDLTDHLQQIPSVFTARPVTARAHRLQIDSGSEWERICGYCRALRVGNRILVSGSTATHGNDRVICKGDARGQAVFILDRIAAAIRALGGNLDDTVRTRIYLANADDWETVSRVHGRVFGELRPANTLLEVSRLVGDYLVEIEAEAVVDD